MNILSIDIGGTYIKYGLFEDKKLKSQGKRPSEANQGYSVLIKNVDQLIEDIINSSTIDALAISTAGIVDVESGEIIHAGPTIPGYKGFNWKNHIMNKFGLKCHLDNDVNCALLGEYSIGAAKGKDKILMLAIGTGIGGAYLSDGKIFRGANACGLELGYMNMGTDKFENFASTSALLAYYQKISGKENSNGIEIFELAKNDDLEAFEAIDYTMDMLAKGIANVTYILDPATILLGGGIMEQESFLRPIIEEKLKKYMLPLAHEKLELLFAKAGNMAASFGALYHFYQMEEQDELF